MTRCNPYGYATDAGPRHLMGGRYGPQYAGDKMLVNADGVHGLGICEEPAAGRFRMVCVNEHARGPVMDLCPYHVAWIQARYCETCTACAMPPQSIELELEMESVMRSLYGANASGDRAATMRLGIRLDDLRRDMDELVRRGIIRPKQPLRLVEVS